jgi:hypothetical protein
MTFRRFLEHSHAHLAEELHLEAQGAQVFRIEYENDVWVAADIRQTQYRLHVLKPDAAVPTAGRVDPPREGLKK